MRAELLTAPAGVTPEVESAVDELDLVIRIVPAPAVTTMWSKTDDGCGRTCESACPNTGC